MSFWRFIRAMIILDWLSGRHNQHDDSVINPFSPDYPEGNDYLNNHYGFPGIDNDYNDLYDDDMINDGMGNYPFDDDDY